MKIILGTQNVPVISDKYVVLELDTILYDAKADPVTAYCVVDDVPILNLPRIKEMSELHHNLLINYRLMDWNFCRNALEHLMGFWGEDMRSFYAILLERIEGYETTSPEEGWSGIVNKLN